MRFLNTRPLALSYMRAVSAKVRVHLPIRGVNTSLGEPPLKFISSFPKPVLTPRVTCHMKSHIGSGPAERIIYKSFAKARGEQILNVCYIYDAFLRPFVHYTSAYVSVLRLQPDPHLPKRHAIMCYHYHACHCVSQACSWHNHLDKSYDAVLHNIVRYIVPR